MWSAQHAQERTRAVGSRPSLGASLHDSDGVVLGAIVDDQHVVATEIIG
jgi:hypothetical protein